MKNNGIIFLGFLIICLVNLSAKNKGDHASAKPSTIATVPIKAAAVPITPTAQVITPSTQVTPTASVGPVASSAGKG